MSSYDFCKMEEFLDNIDISYEDCIEWKDGSCTFMIPNLEEETVQLREGIGLKNLGYNLFHAENNEINISEKLQYIKPFFTKEEESKWCDVIDKILQYERKCSTEGIECPFEPSFLQIQIAVKWKGKITTNLSKFKDFATDLYSFVLEGLKDRINKEYKQHDFWQTMRALRHGYSHDTTRWDEEDRMKIALKQKEFFQDAIKRDSPNSSVNFIACQSRLLENCSDFLDSLFAGLRY